MTSSELVRIWKQLPEDDRRHFVDYVGEHLEKYAGVSSDAGRLGRMEGVDSRALVEAFNYACTQIEGGN